MIKNLFGGGKSKPPPAVINARSAPLAVEAPQEAAQRPHEPIAPVKPAPLPAPDTLDLSVEGVLSGKFRRMPFPAGLSGENGGFLLLTDGQTVVCLRRNDMASTGTGYSWARKLVEAVPHAKVLDVSAAKMREAEQKGEEAISGFRAQGSSTVQQQGFELVEAALKEDASDIHIDIDSQGPRAPQVLIRFRVHGELIQHLHYTDTGSVKVYAEVVRALFQNEATSVAAERNTSVLNDSAGRFYGKLTLPLRATQLRFECDTTSTGSTSNLRVLSYEGKPSLATSLEGLGFASSHVRLQTQAFGAPHGLLLFMGATGAGKTTTVATALAGNPDAIKQYSVGMEQPPEIDIPFMQQLAFDEDDFSHALKGTLRLDPDVIYVGEILSDVVARLAVQAAMTGHLVPATLHANNVSTGLRRLVGDQGMRIPMEDMCAQDMLQLAQAQTLVPTLCVNCRQRALPHLQRDQVSALEALEIDPVNLYVRYQGKGNQCPECKGRGVRSRTILAEVVRPTADFLDALLNEGVSAAMEVYRTSRVAAFWEEDQTGKNVMEHGLYKASIGMICTRALLGMFDVTLHPMVIQKRAAGRALARAARPDQEAGAPS